MTIAKEGDLAAFISREHEAAEQDPFKVEFDQEFFPLKGRVKQFDWNAKARVSIAQLDQISIEPNVEFNAGGSEWAKMFLSRHIKSSDTFDTMHTFAIKRKQNEELPTNFQLGLHFTAKAETDEEIEAAQTTMRSLFRVKVTNHVTGQKYYADTSYEEFAGMFGHTWFIVDKFNEVDENGNVIATQDELIFDNTEEITQQIGVTFESLPEAA